MKIRTKTVEYNIVEHCNLRCINCDHASPSMPKRHVAPEVIGSDLQDLATALHVGELKIIGGEPLLHPRLLDVLRIGRASGIADSVTVATNGTLLHRVTEEFWQSIDRLWLSIYPGVQLGLPLSEIEGFARRYGVALDCFKMASFRHTLLNRRNPDTALVRRIHARCELPSVNVCHTLRDGRFFKCSPAPFLVDRLPGENLASEAQADGVLVRGNPHLARDIEAYLRRTEPLAACWYCLGSSGPQVPHSQGSSRNGAAAPFDDAAALFSIAEKEKQR